MPDTKTLSRPTNKDEAWRYADIPAVESAWPMQTERVEVAEGETYHRQIIVAGDVDDVCLLNLQLTVRKGARAILHGLLAGGKMSRIAVEVTLEDGAHFEFGGVTIGGGDAVREFVTTTIHAEPNATSNQTVRSVHWGTATGNFLGEIKVARHAQKSDAAQDFKGLLLEKGASVNAVPQLEIFADDVKCAHGATVGQLDEAARFYMAARGLSPEMAQRLLVQAFVGDAFVELEDEKTREELLNATLEALENAAL